MTAQIAERLIFEGQEHELFTEPLENYFEQGGINPGFESLSSDLWRGYVGTWEIQADRLYLVDLNGSLQSGELATLESVFPGIPDRVFADWFTGTLRIPQGRKLEYVHMGFGSKYERDLLIIIRKGIVIGQEVHINE
jgi:hypothetical protein